jgi:hypothetical protein
LKRMRAPSARVRCERQSLISSWPGIAVQRTASLPLAHDPAIHAFWLNLKKDVDARDI